MVNADLTGSQCDYPEPLSVASNQTNNDRPNVIQLHQNTKKSFCFILKEELLRFCENTTIRGLPRIVKNTSRDFRILWSFLVVSLIVGCLLCMSFLAREFLAYNVIHPPRVLRDASSPFPGITVCNLRAISKIGREKIINNSWRDPREFALNLFNFTKLMKDPVKSRMGQIRGLLSLPAYLSSINNVTEMKSLGADLEEFVIKCQVTVIDGQRYVTQDCIEVGEWRTITHPTFLNCMMYALNETYRNKTTSIETQFFLGETKMIPDCVDCFTNDLKTQLAGVALVVHPANDLPNINHQTINLDPGTLSEMRLITTENINKEPPYGRCSNDVSKSIFLHNLTFTYSEDACKQEIIQKSIIENCKCIAIEYAHNYISDYQYCGSVNAFLHKESCNSVYFDSLENPKCFEEIDLAIQRSLCKANITKRFTKDVVDQCNLPCKYFSFDLHSTTSKWPPKFWQLTWFEKMRKRYRHFQKPDFSEYDEALKLRDQGRIQEAGEMISRLDIFERNVIGLVVIKPNFNLKRVEEKEVLSLTSLLSQTGGLLSIWIGLTLISLGEILECIIRCCKSVRRQSSRKKEANDQKTNQNVQLTLTSDLDKQYSNFFYNHRSKSLISEEQDHI